MERAELRRRLVAAVEASGRHSRAIVRGEEVFVVEPGVEMPAVASSESADARGWLMVASGGTSGRLKFARHDEITIGAAVQGFCAHFGLTRVNAVSVLPLHHVSGLMAWMRCTLTGGEFAAWEWKRLEAGDLPPVGGDNWVISLVPTQLQRLLAHEAAVAWLRRFRVIFVGGGPMWTTLADAAATARLPIALSYGMTETAAMVTALRPEEFLAGARSSGAPLPHATVTIDTEERVRIGGASLFCGYYPQRAEVREFLTGDLGQIDERGHLHVLGRADAMIITGGKKVQPEVVEAALRASGEFDDVAVLGVPDAEWGEAVVACYPRSGRVPNIAQAVAALAAWQRPKRFVAIDAWPRNAQGKVNRAALREAVG